MYQKEGVNNDSFFLFFAKITQNIMKPIYVKFKKEDNIMVKTTQNMIDETKELEKELIKYMADNETFDELDSDELNLLSKMKAVVDTSMKVMLKQAELLEEQNKKINKILELVKK